MPIDHFDPSAEIAAMMAALDRDGAFVVDGLLDPGTVSAINGEVDPHLAVDARTNGAIETDGGGVRRLSSLVARCPSFRPVVTQPLVLDVVDRFFDHVTNFQLGGAQFTELAPGAPAQGVHQDQWAYDFFDFPPGYEVQCNLMWALTDFDAENGGTRIIPGSHRFDNFRHFVEADTEAVEMSAGSALIYSGRLYHGGGANRSNRIRRGISVNYTAGWVRAQENPHLGLSPEIARTLPVELLWLMGYSRGAFFVNYYDTDRDPIEALFPDAAARGLAAAPDRVRRQMERRWKQFTG